MSEEDVKEIWFRRFGNAVYYLMGSVSLILFTVAIIIEAFVAEVWWKWWPVTRDALVHVSAGLAVAVILFFLVDKVLGFNLLGERLATLDTISSSLSDAVEKLSKANALAKLDLFKYWPRINMVTEDWYDQIENSNGDISLMSPSLDNWFTQPDRMKGLLSRKAIEGKTIRLIIMAHENDVALGISKLPETQAQVNFYDPTALRANEERMTARISAINKKICEDSGGKCRNYVELKKVVGTPIFVKTEFFGDILHWSFFGYNLDGKVAPSFWCRERVVDGEKNPGLYQVLKREFETIWVNDSISKGINVNPDQAVTISE